MEVEGERTKAGSMDEGPVRDSDPGLVTKSVPPRINVPPVKIVFPVGLGLGFRLGLGVAEKQVGCRLRFRERHTERGKQTSTQSDQKQHRGKGTNRA